MKTGFFYLAVICALLLGGVSASVAQEEQKVSKIPFPVERRKETGSTGELPTGYSEVQSDVS
ncbi:hypothetical protein [Sunxiuqinia indica]|uniref:hypothetical protein n=1 Tax=Sunxiuqinia indica TaxID=2692584 RepID=UPI001357D08C|nr:hypothetical protein [Sunxiuqinia indica]